MCQYHHTQNSPLHFLLYLPAIFLFFAAWLLRESSPPSLAAILVGGVFIFLALSFQRLTVRDDGDSLVVHYGPVNLFGTRIKYVDIDDIQTGQTSLIDGWGIHFVPFRGWTINLWGFECVKIRRGKKTIRIGTDDSLGLAEFLTSKIQLGDAEINELQSELVG